MVSGARRSLETGFVYAAHDIPEAVVDDAYAMLGRFFHLPQAVKDRCFVEGARGQTGYTGKLVETAAGAERPDWKEMLNWGPELPEGHPLRRRYPGSYLPRVFPEDEVPGITAVLGLFHARLHDLQRRFLRIIAAGLGCTDTYFDGMLRNGPTLTRAIRYPAMREAPAAGHVWAAEHGDINLITALPRATARGLQVQVGDAWIDAAPPQGHAIINTGLMLERLSNGVLPAGIHRVVADADQTGERLSLVQFCHPSPWTVLAPIPTCVTPRHPPAFAPITAADWLDEVLHDINMDQTG